MQLTNGPALANDWIGVYKAGQNPGKETPSTKWAYVRGASASIAFNGLPAGYYYTTYMLKDGYFEASDRVSFQAGSTIASLSAPAASFPVGTPMTFYFSDGPALAKDYVGIFRKGATPGVDKLVSYLYFGGAASGSVTFTDLAAGEYFAALYTNDSYTEVSIASNSR